MIVHRLFSLFLICSLGSSPILAEGVHGKTSLSINNPDRQSQQPNGQTQSSGANVRTSEPKDSCVQVPRPLNPSAIAQRSETTLDRYFRLAYNAAVAGDFDTAIINYRRAAKLATCDCDRIYAQAGEQAAQEAKALLKAEGEASKPTQFFWGRLQELTKSLSCVTVK